MRKIIFIAASILFLTGFYACDKGDSSANYGFAYIYMPQATIKVFSAGLVQTQL
jgi:hypothetical protein